MEFLVPGSVLQQKSPTIIVGVYTDKITISLVKKEGEKIFRIATAIEPQEGEVISNGTLDVDRITLNCRKALLVLQSIKESAAKDVVFALGAGVGTFSFSQEKCVREMKEKKITEEEVAGLVGSRGQKNDKEMTRSIAESFSIDGFAIGNPVGMHGGELLVGVARMTCSELLMQGLMSVANEAGLSVKGIFDVRYAAAKYANFYNGGQESAILVCVFESEISIVLVRNKAIAGIGTAPRGYGIILRAIQEDFSVGHEEAKKIMRAFVKKELEAHVSERVLGVYDTVCSSLINDISAVVAQLDPTSLLPGNVRIVISESEIPMCKQLQASEWLTALPIERNAAVHVSDIQEYEGYSTEFDHIITKSL